jgi:hypothetical protein
MLLKFVSLILTLLTLSFGVVSYPPSSGGGGGSTLAQGSATPGQLGTLTFGAATTAAPSYTTGFSYPFSMNLSGGLRVDGSGVTQPVSGTFWQATQPVSGTVTTTPPSNASTNIAQINAVTPLMGNGVTGTGSQRVTIASDNTAFTVNAAQSGTWTVQPGNTANTTAWLFAGGKTNNAAVPGATNLGTLDRIANAANPLWTEGNLVAGSVLLNGAQRSDITTILGTAPTTAGKIDFKGADGDVFVRQATAANLNATVVGGKTHNNAAPGATNVGALVAVATAAAPSWTEGNLVAHSTNLVGDTRSISKITDGTTTAGVIAGTTALKTDMSSVAGTATSTAAAGVQKVGIVGNANAAFDAANNATAPANVVVAGFEIQSGATATAGTAGQVRRGVAGLDGVQYARIGGPVTWSCFVEAVTATTQCQAAPGAGLKAYVTSMSCSNEAATVQTVDVVFGTGAACVTGTTALTHKFQFGTNATTTSPFEITHTFMSPLNPTAANAICLRPSAATAFGCTLTGYTAP